MVNKTSISERTITDILNCYVTPIIEDTTQLVYKIDNNAVKITFDEDSKLPVRIVVTRNDNSYVWVHTLIATDKDNKLSLEWSDDYESYNVGDYDSMAFADIYNRSIILFTNEEWPDDVVISLDLNDDIMKYLENLSTQTGDTIDQIINRILADKIESIKNEMKK